MSVSSKEKIIRVLQIFQRTDKETPINAATIISKLKDEFGIETDRRSIYKDVEMLQYCGYPIEQASNKRLGWYMNRHAFEDWEIKVMMDAVQQAKYVSANEAKIIREKLLDLTSERGRQRISHMIIPSDNNLKVDTKLGEYIEIMMEAMYQGRKIKFQYTRRGDKMEKILRRNGEYYIFNLYAIYWSSNNYYLIGAHDHRDELTNYRLDRVENLSMTEEYAIEAEKKIGHNPEMFIRKYIDESVAHFSGKPIRIEVEYEANQVTNAILYDFAGNDIRIRKRRDGKNVAGFTKLDGITLTLWFVQYADMFKVIKPENLKMHVIEQLNKGMEHYKE